MENNPFSPNNPIENADLNVLEQRTLHRTDERERVVFVIARNLIPVIGVLFLGWSAVNLVLLYFADTLAGMWALIAAWLTQFFGGWTTLPFTKRFTNFLYVVGLSLFLIAFFAIPLGVPVLFVLVSQDWQWQDALRDQGFVFGLVSVAALSLVSMLRYAFQFQKNPVDEKWSRKTFGLLFVRWFLMIVLIFATVGLLLPFGPILLVIGYAVMSVISEIYPERFLAAFDHSAARPTTAPAEKAPTAMERARWERKRTRCKK
jgi:MFS family permease